MLVLNLTYLGKVPHFLCFNVLSINMLALFKMGYCMACLFYAYDGYLDPCFIDFFNLLLDAFTWFHV